MGNYVRSFYYYGFNWWLAAITLFTISSNNGHCSFTNCIANNQFHKIGVFDAGTVTNQLEVLPNSIQMGQDRLTESRKFIESFINDLNTRYGFTLTMLDACQLLKTNIDVFQINTEQKNSLKMAINLLEIGILENTESIKKITSSTSSSSIKWPVLVAFQLTSNSDKQGKLHSSKHCTAHIDPNDELPGDCYIGACEAFAGALLCLIPHPSAYAVGTAMMLDGGRRIFDGTVQLGEERRLNPSYRPPEISY